MEVFSAIKDCFGKCLDNNGSNISINITVCNDREYYCTARPRECRPAALRRLARKRSFSVG